MSTSNFFMIPNDKHLRLALVALVRHKHVRIARQVVDAHRLQCPIYFSTVRTKRSLTLRP
jgi:hypothetical protein